MKKMIEMMKKAHGAEIGAVYAYIGHFDSLKDPVQKLKMAHIIRDEYEHISILRGLLKRYRQVPSRRIDLFYKTVGKTLGFLSRVTGWYLPMRVAKQMEKMGTDGYVDMARHASKLKHYDLFNIFMDMANVESEHEQWFADVLKKR